MDLTLTITGTGENLTFKPLAVVGFDDVGQVRMVLPVESVAVDGYRRVRALGYQRLITLALGVVSDVSVQAFLVRWVFAPDRTMTYGGETAALALVDAAKVAADVSSGRLFHRFTLGVQDQTVRLDPAPSWLAAPHAWTSWAQDDIHPFGDTDYTYGSLT